MGALGSRSDGGVLNESQIGQDIVSGKISEYLPEDDYLDHQNEDIKVN